MPSSTGSVRGSELRWRADFTPTFRSLTYTVEVTYLLWRGRPSVSVLDPPLTDRGDGERIPHVFAGNRPCLHFAQEWDPSMWLCQTVVPWTSEWLLFYEIWLATGTWCGGGHEVRPDDFQAG
jgi:hypothetical protein